MKKRLAAFALAFTMLFSLLPFSVVAQADDPYATRGYVADTLLNAADDYNSGVQRSDIIKGYGDGNTMDDQFITRAEAFVMVSRAFGDLPAAGNDWKRSTLTDISFTGVPDWAEADVTKLVRGGILVGTGDGELGADENVTVGQIDIMIRRMYSLFGTRLKDDFYTAINKTALDSSVIKEGDASSSRFAELSDENTERISGIIDDAVNGDYPKNSREEKIATYYTSALNLYNGTNKGIAPLEGYLKAVDEAESIKELFDVQSIMKQETGMDSLVDFAVSQSYTDNKKYDLHFGTISGNLTKADYNNEELVKKYSEYIKKLLIELGENATDAQRHADAVVICEAELMKASLDVADYSNVDAINNPYTLEQLQSMFEDIDLNQILTDDGYKKTDNIIVSDVGLTQKFASFANNENLELMKTFVKVKLISVLATELDVVFYNMIDEFNSAYFGIASGTSTAEELAADITQAVMSDYIGEKYTELYFSEKAKLDIEEMISEFISTYEKRIDSLDWMSGATKERAKEKLNKMTVYAGYGEPIDDSYDIFKFLPLKGDEENAYFSNNSLYRKISREMAAMKQDRTVTTYFPVPVYTVNAFYDPQNNSITIPAGILQGAFYDVNAPKERNLGSIGAVIAHEISHAFDNKGSKFDADGNAADWWTKEDYEKFTALCGDVASFYDGYEYAPGIVNNGTQTLGENIADLGGVACALDVMKTLDNPDYKAFFEGYANMWYHTGTRQYLEYLSNMDVHSSANLRVNRTVLNFDEFYKCYGINENDGMYVKPRNRVKIW